jgi:hypothetical protein
MMVDEERCRRGRWELTKEDGAVRRHVEGAQARVELLRGEEHGDIQSALRLGVPGEGVLAREDGWLGSRRGKDEKLVQVRRVPALLVDGCISAMKVSLKGSAVFHLSTKAATGMSSTSGILEYRPSHTARPETLK